MTVTSGNQLAVGARAGFLFPLNSDGFPAASSTAVYEGLELKGLKAGDLNVPNPRVITHAGNDRVLANDFLPSLEPITGEVRVANLGMDANAAVMDVNKFSVGEMAFMPWGTDKQGSEIDTGLFLFQQSLDTTSKLRRYRVIIAAKTRAIPLASGMNENPNEQRYQIVTNPSSKHIWGTSLVEATEGATEAAFIEGMSTYRPNLVAWKADGTEDNFLFPTSKPAADHTTPKITVWDNGTLKSSGVTYAADGITFTSAPTSGHIIVCLYEY